MPGNSGNPYLLTNPHLLSAKKKIGSIAAYYDPKKISFKGFDAAALNPTEFREQLRRNLLVKMTNQELGAIVMLFDKDGDGFVDSTEFINGFFQLGKQEKAKQFKKYQEIKEKLDKEREEVQAAHVKRYTDRMIVHYPDIKDVSPEVQKSAMAKISEIAFTYEPSFIGGGLSGFTMCAAMGPTEFREQLRRNFELYLSPGEISTLMHVFDRDKNGKIDSTEFLYNFYNLGRIEKERHFNRQKHLNEVADQLEKERKKAEKERFEKLAVVKCETNPKKKDRNSAMEKIKHAAIFHKGSSQGVAKSFEAMSLGPAAFKEQMRRQFLMKLNPGELGALVKEFDMDGDGMVTSSEFLSTFFRIGSKGKRKLHEKKIRIMREIEEAEKLRIAENLKRAKLSVLTSVVFPDLAPSSSLNDSIDDETEFILPVTPIKRPNTVGSSRATSSRRSRKPALGESIGMKMDGDGFVSANSENMRRLFPGARPETFEFLEEISALENKIEKDLEKKKNDYERRLILGNTSSSVFSPSKSSMKSPNKQSKNSSVLPPIEGNQSPNSQSATAQSDVQSAQERFDFENASGEFDGGDRALHISTW